LTITFAFPISWCVGLEPGFVQLKLQRMKVR
jgi:hypothetical protein